MDDTTPGTPAPGSKGHHLAAGESVADLKRRITELEVALAAMTRQREETRRMLFELYDAAFPEDPPPTEEELLEERKTLTTKSISEFLAEFQSGLAREKGA